MAYYECECDNFDMTEGQDTFEMNEGIPGPGVPAGGSAGQVLRKTTSADYDTEWDTLDAGEIPYSGLTSYPNNTVGSKVYELDSGVNSLWNYAVQANTKASNALDNEATAYNYHLQYHVGDYCLYQQKLYRCIVETPSAGEMWNSSHWTEVTVGDEMSETASDISVLRNTLTDSNNVIIYSEYLENDINGFKKDVADLIAGNLFNVSSPDVKIGYVLTGTGEVAEQAGYTVSNFIPVRGIKKLTVSAGPQLLSTPHRILYYDWDKETIVGNESYVSTLTIPNNAYYARFSIQISDPASQKLMVSIGTSALPFVAYYTPYYAIKNPEVAPEFDASVANASGTYVTKDGKLYLLPLGHNSDVAWESTSKIECTVSSEFKAIGTRIDGIDADLVEISSDIDDIEENANNLRKNIIRNNTLQYGHTSINADYVLGLISNNGIVNTDYKCRVTSRNIFHTTEQIYLHMYDESGNIGGIIHYYTSDADSSYEGSVSFTTKATIQKNRYFRLSIRILPETDLSRVLTQDEADSMWNSVGFASYQKQIVELNNDKEQMIYNLQQGRSVRFEDTYEPLEFLHFSDIHVSPENWQRICNFMDKYHSVIPFALHTGDYVGQIQSNYIDLYGVQSPKHGYILNCTGNHDTYVSIDPLTIGSASSVYNLLFNHISDWGVTFGTAQYAMYYYKDFVDSGVRLIVLDQFYWDNTQETWFQNLLDDAIANNKAVITASHVITAGLPADKRVNCTFTSHDIWAMDEETDQVVVAAIDPMIKAFKDAGGEHICHLCGHYHHDIMGYTDNGILNIVIGCATYADADWCDSERVDGTRGFDLFNVMAVDRSLHMIRLVRIGNNVDYYGREKNILCYDYLNKTVIANS